MPRPGNQDLAAVGSHLHLWLAWGRLHSRDALAQFAQSRRQPAKVLLFSGVLPGGASEGSEAW